jgi:hypothetical protein
VPTVAPPKQSKKGLMWGLIAAGLVLVAGAIVSILLFTQKKDNTSETSNRTNELFTGITTMEEFMSAAREQKALNCEITLENSGPFGDETQTLLIQADEGWNNFHMRSATGGTSLDILALGEGSIFQWGNGVGGDIVGYEISPDDPSYAEFKERINQISVLIDQQLPSTISEDESEGVTLRCESPDLSDFSLPDDIEFEDYDEAIVLQNTR